MQYYFNKKIIFLTFLMMLSFAALQAAFLLPLHVFILYPFFMLYSLAYHSLHRRKQKGVIIAFYIGILVLGIIGASYLLEGGRIAYNLIVTHYEQNSKYLFNLYEITVLKEKYPIYLTMLCMYLYIWLYSLSYECLRRYRNTCAFLTSFILFFPILLYSTPQPWLFTLPLIAGWLTLLWCAFANKLKINRDVMWIKSFLISMTLCLGCFFMLPESSFSNRPETEHIRDMILNKIDMFIYNVTHSGESVGEVDLGRAGNRYYSGATQLKVTSENKYKRLYLKSYSGAIYENNHWVSLPDTNYQFLPDEEQKNTFTWFNEQVYEHGELNEDAKTDLTRKLFKINIEDLRASKTYAIYPYMMQSSKSNLKHHYDLYMESNTNDYEYKLWNVEGLGVYYTYPLETTYLKFVINHYLQVPEELRATLSSMNVGIDRSAEEVSSSDIINKIREYLANHTSYTLSPGRTPDGKDFVEYFIDENKQGYCVHYATTATLLLRYYGIPARYAEGFVVEPNNYDGNIAKIPDRNAHAWVEIFDNEKGWIPIEMTPTFTDTKEKDTEPDKPKDNANKNTTNQQTQKNAQTEDHETTGTTDLENDASDTSLFSMGIMIYLVIAGGVIFTIIAILLQRNIRLLKRKKACVQKDYRKAILQSYEYMHMCGVDTEIDERIQVLIDKAQYSKHEITAEQRIQVYKYAIHRVKLHYQSLSFYQRFIFRYYKALW